MGKDTEIELSVAEYETGFGIQLWKLYADIVELSVISPGGISTGVLSRRLGAQGSHGQYGASDLLWKAQPLQPGPGNLSESASCGKLRSERNLEDTADAQKGGSRTSTICGCRAEEA